MELFYIFIGAVFVNNFVLVRFLGICPFMGVSKQTETALGMGLATTFVMVVSAALTWLLQWFVLEPFGLPFLQTPVFILSIASMVQLVEMFLNKTSPGLHRALGIYLPLITTNCAVLGFSLIAVQGAYSFIQSIIFGLGAGVGFTLALMLLAGIREEMQFADVPEPLKGIGIAFVIAGLLSLAFSGFSGLV
ncbi:MAG: electron transport complex subunit RsxA [Firmicutes bacterium]|nr:electron transport complex subunit RsxA [Bacillota bacterium]